MNPVFSPHLNLLKSQSTVAVAPSPSSSARSSGTFRSVAQDANLEQSRSNWLDYFLPTTNEEDRRRSRLLVAGCLAIILFALPLACVDAFFEGYASPTVFSFVVVVCYILYVDIDVDIKTRQTHFQQIFVDDVVKSYERSTLHLSDMSFIFNYSIRPFF